MTETTPPNPFSSSFNVQDNRDCLIVIFLSVGYMPVSLVKKALAVEFPNSSTIRLGDLKDGTPIAFINFNSEKAYSLAARRINKEVTVCGFTGIIRKHCRPTQPNQHVELPVPHEKYDNPWRKQSGKECGYPSRPKQHVESPVSREKYDNPWRKQPETSAKEFGRPAQPKQHAESPVSHEKYDSPWRKRLETSGTEFGRHAQPKQHVELPVPHEKYDSPWRKRSETSGKEFGHPAQPKQHIESPVHHDKFDHSWWRKKSETSGKKLAQPKQHVESHEKFDTPWRKPSETSGKEFGRTLQSKQHVEPPVLKIFKQPEASGESTSRSYTISDVRYRLWFEKWKDEKELAAISKQHNVWIDREWNDDCLSNKLSGTRNNVEKAFASFKAYADKVTSELQSLPVQIDRQRAAIILAQRNKITKIEQNLGVEILLPKMNFGVVIRATNQAIELVSGNIIHETVDAIANAANAMLDHEDGIAKVIADAAGQQLRDECKNYIDQYRSMPTGQAFVTTAGDLQKKGVKYVIHAIAPVWSSGTNKEEERLHAAVANALLLANSNGCKTVALPSISMGLYGFPHEKGAKVIVDAVVQTLPKTRIHKVRIIDYNPEPVAKRAPIKDRDDIDAEDAYQQNSTEIYPILRKELSERWKEIGDNDKITTGPAASSDLTILQPLPYQWFWKETVGGKHDNGQQWVMYDRDQNIEIEDAHNKWLTPISIPVLALVKIVMSGTTYEILFDDNGHFQKNMKTGYKRSIMRKDIIIPVVAETQPPSPQITSNSDEKPIPVNYQYWKDLVEFMITGRRDDTETAAQELESLVKLKTEFLLVSGLGKIDRMERDEAVRRIARHLDVNVEINTMDNTIKLTGHEGSVDTVRAEIYKWALDKLSNIDNDVPKGWDKFDEKVNCVLVALGATSKDWDTVVSRVHQTMPHANIQKIERVQNRHLWSTYQHNHKQISKKNEGQVNVISLFHGTSKTPPSSIYESEEGFDPRLSAEGMWGKGCYFAVNASYSNNYASTSDLGRKQFFLADVITGDSVYLAKNKSITLPPVKAMQGGNFKNERHDSVKGYTNGSDIYIVYSPGRFYPTYLITYG